MDSWSLVNLPAVYFCGLGICFQDDVTYSVERHIWHDVCRII